MKIIIIGAGPGGYETALAAAKRGAEVTLIESGQPGGTCLNEGCIPTKAFCRNAYMLDELSAAASFGISDLEYKFDFRSVKLRKDAVVEQLRSGVESLLSHKMIEFVRGKAYFKDMHTVCVDSSEGLKEFTGDYIIIATGSVSASLPVPGAELTQVLTSREMLDLEEVPRRLCVIGGGVIGLEMASVFRSFGSEVTVLEYAKDILPRFDSDLAKRLKQLLVKRGIVINTQSEVKSIVQNEDSACEVVFVRKGKEEAVECDKVLMAVGRRANTASLNLSDVGISFDSKGICVNGFMQTNIPHIYAVGDVNGLMMLAHAAVFQGVVALGHIMGTSCGVNLAVMPSAVFTSPEAASVGMTEDECKAAGIPVRCLKSFFRANGKAVAMGDTDGYCKLVVSDEPSGRILGCHLIGPHSADIIHEACAMITRGASLDEMRCVIHAHPTLSEILQNAVHA